MSDLENWEIGEPLSFAFYKFSDPYQLAQYQESQDRGRTETLKFLMYGNLFADLMGETFAAFGFCLAPNVSDGPVLIPRHCFEPRPNIEECDRDVITASGWQYERVRIVETKDLVACSNIQPNAAQIPTGKVGRPSKYPQAAKTLAMLAMEDKRYIYQSAESLHERFNVRYLELYKIDGISMAPIAVRTLRDFLKRFRQETTESGNNNSAN